MYLAYQSLATNKEFPELIDALMFAHNKGGFFKLINLENTETVGFVENGSVFWPQDNWTYIGTPKPNLIVEVSVMDVVKRALYTTLATFFDGMYWHLEEGRRPFEDWEQVYCYRIPTRSPVGSLEGIR
jgi:hypothetical protein